MKNDEPITPWRLFLLSAPTELELRAIARELLVDFELRPETYFEGPARIHRVLRGGGGEHRGMLVCTGAADAKRAMAEPDTGNFAAGFVPPVERPIAFMFPGLGDHYVGMGLGLYRAEAVFREQVDLCCELLAPELGKDLRHIMYPQGGAESAAKPGIDLRKMLGRLTEPAGANERLNEPLFAQSALFVVEVALAKLFESWGAKPACLIGYSLGEYVAACLAGVLSLEDSLRLVARRAKLVQRLPAGAMLGVALPETEVRASMGEELSISAINGPDLCVVAGPPDAIADYERRLGASGTAAQRVRSTHAFHSRMMEPAAEEVAQLVGTFTLRPPQIPYFSNVTGAPITVLEATDPTYWARHLCKPVRFADGLEALSRSGERILLEVGPGQTLTSLATLHPAVKTPLVFASMRPSYDARPDVAALYKTLGRLWLAGARLAWDCFPAISPPKPSAKAEAIETTRSPGESAEPRTEAEKELAAIWRKLFNVEHIGLDQSFFDLGGNSLLASRLLFRILKTFRVNLSLRNVYEAPTIASLALAVEDLLAANRGENAKRPASRPEPARAPRAMQHHTLPNGMKIAHQSEAETRHFYEDIFAHRSYVKHGIVIPDGGCVFDVGANIGLFTLFAHGEAKGVRIYAFEPAPPLFEILRSNVETHGACAKLFPVGISSEAKSANFTFYPASSGMSSFHADDAEERHVLETIMRNQQKKGMAEMDRVLEHAADLLDLRLRAHHYTCPLRRLSDVIAETAVSRIDLLKVDVQKCELEVLEGIDAEHWPNIRQIALEVHDMDGRARRITALLEGRGYKVAREQDELYVGTNIYNVYAVRM